jgi:hypothetical protein
MFANYTQKGNETLESRRYFKALELFYYFKLIFPQPPRGPGWHPIISNPGILICLISTLPQKSPRL